MEPFQYYSSIENTTNNKALQTIREHVPSTILWVATEKIHGCNFSAITNGETINWAKRSSYLKENEMKKFNNSHYIKEKYSENIKNLIKVINNSQCVRIYGELCGGKYGDMKTSHPQNIKGIQKEVQYSPDIEFIVFDIKVQDKELNWNFLCHNDVNKYCDMVGLKSVRIMHRGTLEQLLQLDPIFRTTIPSYFSLPHLENNMSEGYVFKPVHDITMNNDIRVILKHKNPYFSEKNIMKIRAITITQVDENVQDIVDIISMYVNINKINNVMSKHGNITNEKRKIGLIYQDVIEDAKKDFDESMLKHYNNYKNLIIPAINYLIKEKLSL